MEIVMDESLTPFAADGFNPAINRRVFIKHGIIGILGKRNFPVKRKIVI